MAFWWSILVYGAIFYIIVYLISIWRYSYWKRKGVYGPAPSLFFGNIKDVIFLRKSIGELFSENYDATKALPFIGIYTLQGRTLVINDLELIKTILTKDFYHFSDRGVRINEKKDPIAMHLFTAAGEKWKNLRVKLTPTFTTAKMKYMFNTVVECNIEMMDFLQEKLEKDSKIDVKDLIATLNTDVIGSCAFGIDCNSFRHPDAEFRTWGRRLFNMNARQAVLRFFTLFAPGLMKLLNLGFLSQDLIDFFYNTVDSTIKYREENNVTRNDFMQLLIQLKTVGYIEGDTENPETGFNDATRLTTMQIAAQVFVFFVAGFETSSTTASFALYELALNPDIQLKVQEDIDQVLDKHGGKVTYDALGEMNYLTKVIEETLRKYPPLPVILRICTKRYTIPNTDVVIEKDTPVMIPVLGIHRDPELYPNPLVFNPDRFNEGNKADRHHFSYLPFGEGPRICIGMRFGLMQTKLGLVSLLSKYHVSVCEKTPAPIHYDKRSLIMAAEGGMWLRLTNRNTI